MPPPEPEAPGGDDNIRGCRRRNMASSNTHSKRWGGGDLVYSHTWITKTDTRRVHVKTQTPRQPSRTTSHDKLALQHAHRACETYRLAQVTETALQHLRELRAVCAKTLKAKQDYHLPVTNLLKEHT